MDSLFEFAMTMSFLVTLIVVVRLNAGLRVLNARVTMMHDSIRELRQRLGMQANASSPAPVGAARPSMPGESVADRSTHVVEGDVGSMEEMEEELQRLEAQMRRDFPAPKPRPAGKPPTAGGIPKLRAVPPQRPPRS